MPVTMLRCLSLLLLAATCAPAFSAMITPPEDQAQAAFDRISMQREAMVRDSQDLQRERVRLLEAKDAQILALRGKPNAVMEDDVIAAARTDPADRPIGPIARYALLVLALGAVLLIILGVAYSRRVFAAASERRRRMLESRRQAGNSLGDVNAMLDQRVGGRTKN